LTNVSVVKHVIYFGTEGVLLLLESIVVKIGFELVKLFDFTFLSLENVLNKM
jgi:hypothetical protein